MQVTKEDIDIIRRAIKSLKKFFERALQKVKKVVEKFQIRKYWNSKELKKLVYSKQKVKTKRLKKKYDDKIKRFIFRQIQLKA